MTRPFQKYPKCGSSNIIFEGGLSLSSNMIIRFVRKVISIAGGRKSVGFPGGQYVYICKNCGATGVICVN